MFLAFFWISVWVASTCSTSDVPMPCASAPKAPCVEVWLSPQTMVMPGRVKPCSGPMMWTMPWRLSCSSKYSTPKSRGVLGQRLDLDAAFRVVDAAASGRWSARCGRRRPASSPGARTLRPVSAGLRRPAGSSPRARGGGRYRGGRCRPSLSVDDMVVPDLVVERARRHGRVILSIVPEAGASLIPSPLQEKCRLVRRAGPGALFSSRAGAATVAPHRA